MRRLHVALVLALALCLWLAGASAPSGGALAQGNGGNAFFGQNVRLGPGESISGDMAIFGGSAVFEAGSAVHGDVSLLGGELTINGAVHGDVVAFGGLVDLGATAVVDGDVVALGAVRRHPDAVIRGKLTQGLEATRSLGALPWALQGNGTWPAVRPPQALGPAWMLGAARGLVGLMAVLLVALAAALILPTNLRNIGRVMVSSAPLSVAVGLLTVAVLVVLVPLLTVICIGIPVAIVLALAGLLCALIGWIAVGQVVGERLWRLLRVATPAPVVEALLGTLLISLLAMIPCVGWLLALLLLLWGLGAVVLTRLGTSADPFWSPAPRHPAMGECEPAPIATEDAAQPTRLLEDQPETDEDDSPQG